MKYVEFKLYVYKHVNKHTYINKYYLCTYMDIDNSKMIH